MTDKLTFTPPSRIEVKTLNQMLREARLPVAERGVTWAQAAECLGRNPFKLGRMDKTEEAAVRTLSLWARHYKAVKHDPHDSEGLRFVLACKSGSKSKRERVKAMVRKGSLDAFCEDAARMAGQMTPGIKVNYTNLFWDFFNLTHRRHPNQVFARWTRDAHIFTPTNTNTTKESA